MKRSELIRNRLIECVHNGEISTQDQREIVETVSAYLGLKTLTDYAKSRNISYQAARKHINNTVNISGIEFIIDNQ